MLKHNKKKNSRIVYEQLMQLATRLALTNHIVESRHILKIVKERFSPNTLLGKEKKLFDAVLETRTVSLQEAEDLITETLIEAKTIDQNRIEKERVDLINTIMSNIGVDLFSIPIKEYKLIASTQILLNEAMNGFKFSNPQERIKIKKKLIENINQEVLKEESYEMDNFTYSILVKNFNEKYAPLMNEDQKEILVGWINYLMTENANEFTVLLKNKIIKAKAELDISLIKEDHQNAEYFEMLKEAKETISKEELVINEDSVHKIMRYFDLIDDLREIDNEKRQVNQINS